MKKTSLLCIGLALATGLIACQKSGESGKTQATSALESSESGGSISGEAFSGDYVTVLCRKYKECGIQAFKTDSDCHNRIKAILDKDPNWKELSLDKIALRSCLKDFKKFECDKFKGGKAPDSCQKL